MGVGQARGLLEVRDAYPVSPQAMLLATVSLKRKTSWLTIPISRRRLWVFRSRTSTPSIHTVPAATS